MTIDNINLIFFCVFHCALIANKLSGDCHGSEPPLSQNELFETFWFTTCKKSGTWEPSSLTFLGENPDIFRNQSFKTICQNFAWIWRKKDWNEYQLCYIHTQVALILTLITLNFKPKFGSRTKINFFHVCRIEATNLAFNINLEINIVCFCYYNIPGFSKGMMD